MRNHRPDDTGHRIPLLATGDHDCPYLPDRYARTSFVDPGASLNPALYRTLLDRGFRRSGPYLYRPVCRACNACETLRIPVAEFRPRRWQRRCLRRNADLRVDAVPARFNAEHYSLYARYVSTRHAGGSMDDPTPTAYQTFLIASWCETVFLEFRDGRRLVAVAVVDWLGDALSAVYTFYDPELMHRGLGTYAILREIEIARSEGMKWLYLGYWIEGCARMSYKADFRPHEVLGATGWRRAEAP